MSYGISSSLGKSVHQSVPQSVTSHFLIATKRLYESQSVRSVSVSATGRRIAIINSGIGYAVYTASFLSESGKYRHPRTAFLPIEILSKIPSAAVAADRFYNLSSRVATAVTAAICSGILSLAEYNSTLRGVVVIAVIALFQDGKI